MFQVIPGACRDGDDLYVLSFDDGIELEMPKKETLGQYYPNGSGGAWTPVFRRDPKSGYFQFLGADSHHMLTKVLSSSGECPDLEVGIHGSYCGKAGAEPCRGTLEYGLQAGYRLKLPFQDVPIAVVNERVPELHGSAAILQCPVQIVPGKSFGQLALGMSREEVAKLGLVRKNIASSPVDQIVGMFLVQYSGDGTVIDIGAEVKDLPDCLYFGKTKIKRELGGAELAKQFKGCKDQEIRKGGNTINCPFMWIQESVGQRSPVIRIHAADYGRTF